MSDKPITTPSKKITKKVIRKNIEAKLAIALAEYKILLGEKKFDNRIRKAARMIGAGIRIAKSKKIKTRKVKEAG